MVKFTYPYDDSAIFPIVKMIATQTFPLLFAYARSKLDRV